MFGSTTYSNHYDRGLFVLLLYTLFFLVLFSVNLAEIDQKLESLSKIDSLKICEVCKPGILESVSDVNAYEPIVTVFELPPDVFVVIQKLKK